MNTDNYPNKPTHLKRIQGGLPEMFQYFGKIMWFSNRIVPEVPIYLRQGKRNVEAAVGGCGNAVNKASPATKLYSKKQRNKGCVWSAGANITENVCGPRL